MPISRNRFKNIRKRKRETKKKIRKLNKKKPKYKQTFRRNRRGLDLTNKTLKQHGGSKTRSRQKKKSGKKGKRKTSKNIRNKKSNTSAAGSTTLTLAKGAVSRNRKRRQDMPLNFIENGSIYIFKPEILINHGNRLGGKIVSYLMEFWQTWDIDTKDEVDLVEYYLKNKKINQYY